MNEHMVSLYIDNALTLPEKLEFVEAVAGDESFYRLSRELLQQEQELVAVLAEPASAEKEKTVVGRPAWWFFFPRRPLSAVACGFMLACTLLTGLYLLRPDIAEPPQVAEAHRFVLYLPDVREASVIGSFSNWSPIPMEKIGDSGYWTLKLALQPGEHRYSYLIEQQARMFDPTIPDREADDFGGENSILNIGTEI